MAELHIIGRLRGAEDFKERALFCKWALQCGSGWRIIAGQTDGQTQVDRCQQPLDTATWCHPIDLLIVCRGLQGWPRIVVQVYREDWYGRRDLCGYGVATIPSTPGHHTVTCHTWRPTGTFLEELRREFVGGGPQILSTDYIFSASERYKLRTAPAGKVGLKNRILFMHLTKDCIPLFYTFQHISEIPIVILDLGIIMRGFDKHGVNSCDIGCCCDPDCSADDKRAFLGCVSVPRSLSGDARYCTQRWVLDRHNTEYSIDTSNPDLFCIVTDNLVQRTTFPSVKAIKTDEAFHELLAERRKFIQRDPIHQQARKGGAQTMPPNKQYTEGDLVWGITQEGRFFPLGLPSAVFSASCEGKAPFKYLQDATKECRRQVPLQELLKTRPRYLDPRTYCNFFVLSQPLLIYEVEYRWFQDENQQVVKRSGRPGYIRGKPLLFGHVVRNVTDAGIKMEAIARNTDPLEGLTVLRGGDDGDCSARTPVMFGENLQTQCQMHVTFNDILNNCSEVRKRVRNKLLGSVLNNPDLELRVGAYGDSDVLVTSHWVPLMRSRDTTRPFYEHDSEMSAEGRCSDILVSYTIEVAYALQGSLVNPQAKVLL
ncbi:hypothetical protein HAZT_HAZT002231 [Hyalella azteca]|uniref:Uncharacterized protein n=1 Tax=Hyalella azteca TaxID=294128 RepID=A0A6A0H416_HYAAZ|nr:hypothetical protein HAZT_HAZT002231 [Hyalella azteca]